MAGKRPPIKIDSTVLLVLLVAVVWGVQRRLEFFETGQAVHPDEIFQTLEQGHVLAFGVGMSSMEYTRTMALRSHATPLLYAGVMRTADALGFDHLEAARTAHRVLTGTLLPVAGFLYVLQTTRSGGCAAAAALLLALDDVLVGLGAQTLPNALSAPLLLLAAWWFRRCHDGGESVSARGCLLAGAVAGAVVYVRPDSAFAAAALLLLTGESLVDAPLRAVRLRRWAWLACGGAAAAAAGVALDSVMYGKFVLTPWRWFRYNILEKESEVHGVAPALWYFDWLLPPDQALLSLVACAIGGMVARALYASRMRAIAAGGGLEADDALELQRARGGTRGAPGRAGEAAGGAAGSDEDDGELPAGHAAADLGGAWWSSSTKQPRQVPQRAAAKRGARKRGRKAAPAAGPVAAVRSSRRRGVAPPPPPQGGRPGSTPDGWLLLQAVVVGAVFSAVPHKEIRFVHDAYVLVLLFVAASMGNSLEALAAQFRISRRAQVVFSGALLSVVVWLAVRDVNHAALPAHRAANPSHGLALRDIGRANDNVTGVVVMDDWFRSGAWGALHAPVPMWFLTQGRQLEVQPVPVDNPWFDAPFDADTWTNVSTTCRAPVAPSPSRARLNACASPVATLRCRSLWSTGWRS